MIFVALGSFLIDGYNKWKHILCPIKVLFHQLNFIFQPLQIHFYGYWIEEHFRPLWWLQVFKGLKKTSASLKGKSNVFLRLLSVTYNYLY